MTVKHGVREAAGLRYHRVAASSRPTLLVLLCHGYGAPGTDLVPLGEELIRASEVIATHVTFLFPEAPLSLGGFPGFEQRAWWPIDVAALEAAMMRGAVVDRRLECPFQLQELRPRLLEILAVERHNAAEQETTQGAPAPLPMSRVVLGGFSQGAMLTTDLALGMQESPGALAIFSGTVLCETEWRGLASHRQGLRILQSHGRQDPLLAFHAAETLRDLFTEAGAEIQFVPFDGQHEIPLPVLIAFRDLLEGLVADCPG